ncbi:MAG TPA: hypothetical protein PLS48_12145 [Methanotrichaceae archaeon]|nr:hypothetical protein [Methanotrichaceae archaeon]
MGLIEEIPVPVLPKDDWRGRPEPELQFSSPDQIRDFVEMQPPERRKAATMEVLNWAAYHIEKFFDSAEAGGVEELFQVASWVQKIWETQPNPFDEISGREYIVKKAGYLRKLGRSGATNRISPIGDIREYKPGWRDR